MGHPWVQVVLYKGTVPVVLSAQQPLGGSLALVPHKSHCGPGKDLDVLTKTQMSGMSVKSHGRDLRFTEQPESALGLSAALQV